MFVIFHKKLLQLNKVLEQSIKHNFMLQRNSAQNFNGFSKFKLDVHSKTLHRPPYNNDSVSCVIIFSIVPDKSVLQFLA